MSKTNATFTDLRFDFSQFQPEARERIRKRFEDAIAEEPRFSLVTSDDEGRAEELPDEMLDMLAAAGTVIDPTKDQLS